MKLMNVSSKSLPNTFAMVDDEDFEKLSQYNWSARKTKSGNIYVSCMYWIPKTKETASRNTNLSMHRVVTDTPSGLEVDHIDGNGLNNQKSNLRGVTPTQNSHNSKPRRNNKLGIKGVCWANKVKKYRAQIKANHPVYGKYITVDCDTLEHAKYAYAWMEFYSHGEYAYSRRPKEKTEQSVPQKELIY